MALVGIGVGILFGRSPGIHFGAGQYGGQRPVDVAIPVEIALWRVNVRYPKVTRALGAVIRLISIVTEALILHAAIAITTACIGALRTELAYASNQYEPLKRAPHGQSVLQLLRQRTINLLPLANGNWAALLPL
jgi:hypothetical protein